MNGDRSEDGYWRKVGDTLADCEEKQRNGDFNDFATGDVCKMGDPHKLDWKIYIYIPSDKRYHFYTLEETKSCLSDRGLKSMLFQGDSIVRGYFGDILPILSEMEQGPKYAELLKNRMHKGEGAIMADLGSSSAIPSLKYRQEWQDYDQVIQPLKDDLVNHKADVLVWNHGSPAHKVPDRMQKFWGAVTKGELLCAASNVKANRKVLFSSNAGHLS
jgi:hypothetical protein